MVSHKLLSLESDYYTTGLKITNDPIAYKQTLNYTPVLQVHHDPIWDMDIVTVVHVIWLLLKWCDSDHDGFSASKQY